MSETSFIKSIASDIRYAPATVGAFIFFVLLLFIDKLPKLVQQWFVPSIAVYTMAASIVGYAQAILYARKGENLPNWQSMLFMLIHIFLLVCLVTYNSWRGVL